MALDTPSSVQQGRIAFGRGVCGSLDEAARREWLVTDGLGGYAMGTVAGLRTRRYHGLLMTAMAPAGSSRMLGLAALDVVAVVEGRRIRLSTHEWADGSIDPRGHEHLAGFDLTDGVPRWRYDLGAAQLEVEIAMANGRSEVAIVHRLGRGAARLEVTPLCTWRDQHGDRTGEGFPAVTLSASGFVFESAYRVDGPGFVAGGKWYRGAHHREEATRGLGATEDLWAAGRFVADLTAGETLGITASALVDQASDVAAPPSDPIAIISAARARADEFAEMAGAADGIDRILAIAADQFIVTTPTGPTAVAGYPWFGEWSRDLFTSYEGLFLCTGRAAEGEAVLRRAAATVSQGMLANTADVGTLEYNTIDGTLWFLHALGRHIAHTSDTALADDLAGTVTAIVTAHRDGTRFGIGVDPGSGLLRGGADGWALTWMDARVDGRPITPRTGYPVEVQALWINGLGVTVDVLVAAGRPVDEWAALREQAVTSFRQRFPADGVGLFDRLDEAGAGVAELRPNQLLAASLPQGPIDDPAEIARIVEACARHLLTSVGMRSLSPDDAQFIGRHRGGPAERDAAYHQGTIWPWLIGPYLTSTARAGLGTSHILDGLSLHLAEFGLGSVSETADGDPPHAATGCPFQAWSVAEMIRARSGRATPGGGP